MFKEFIRSPKYRRRLSVIVAAAIGLPFVFYFHASSRGQPKGAGGAAGMMFGKAVPWEAFQEERAHLRRTWERQFGPLPDMLLPMLTQSTWDRLLLFEEAKRRRLRIDNRQLIQIIEQDPGFQRKGRFDLATYRAILRAQGMAPQAYEQRVREALMVQQLMQSITNAVTVTDEEVEAAFRTAHEQRRALVLIARPSAFLAEVEAAITDEDVRRAYEATPEAWRIPEQLTIAYTGLSREQAAATVQPSEEEIAASYEERTEEWENGQGARKPLQEVREEIRQRVIATEAQRRLNRLLSDLEEDVEAKRSFDDIVASRQLIPQTAGPLAIDSAWAPTGSDPAFLDAVRELAEGATSEVIDLEEGVYLARLITRQPSRVPPLEEVRDQLRGQLVQERTRTMARERLAALRNRIMQRMPQRWRFEEVGLLEPWWPSVSATVTRTSPVDATIGVAPAINQAVFATPLGQLSELIEAEAGIALVRPEAVIPPDMTAFAQQKDALREETLSNKRAEQFQSWLQDLRARAKLQSFVDTAGG